MSKKTRVSEKALNFAGETLESIKELAEKIYDMSEVEFDRGYLGGRKFPLMAVVPIHESLNGHNYPLDEVVIRRGAVMEVGVEHTNLFFSNSIIDGNHMTSDMEYLRCPTVDEIEDFLKVMCVFGGEFRLLKGMYS